MVGSTSFLEQHFGRALREGLEIGGYICKFLDIQIYYSSLHERAVRFVVQVRSTDRSGLRRHETQCEDLTRQVEIDDLSPHTDGALPMLTNMIWEKCQATSFLRENLSCSLSLEFRGVWRGRTGMIHHHVVVSLVHIFILEIQAPLNSN